MKHWQVSQRNAALAVGTLIYTIIKAGVPKTFADNWLGTLLPSLPLSFGPLDTRIAQSAIEGIGLVTFILLAEIVLLAWSARSLLGEWVYKSSAGNWGHVVLSVDKSEGRLRYNVDLYRAEDDLLHSLRSKELRGCIGHGSDRLTLHDKNATMIWYHVPENRTSETYYPERQGILTLERSNQPNALSARWARIGAISASHDAKTATRGNEINKQDYSNASGSFLFFMRRRAFEAAQKARAASASA